MIYVGNFFRTETLVHRFVRLLIGAAGLSHFAIMSGYENATGIDRTGALADDLRSRGFNIIEGFGSYKGMKERSLLILSQTADGGFTFEEYQALLALSAQYQQESFLLNMPGAAVFQYNNGAREFVGSGRYTIGEDAKQLDFYSEFAGVAFSVV